MRTRLPLAALSIALAIVFSSSAEAACARWDLSGDWAAIQSNGFQPRFVLRQTPTGYQGEAAYVTSGGVTSYFLIGHKGNPAKIVQGTAEGAIRGNSIEIIARWNNGATGIYAGTINDFGRVQGTTYDQRNQSSTASWVSDRNLKCASTASAPKKPAKPIRVLGRGPSNTSIDYGGVAKRATCGAGMTGTPPNCHPLVK